MATYDPALLDALEALPSKDWQGHVWRHMFNDYAPERINTGGARWNPPGIGAIYTSLERETAIAESEHAIEVQPRRIFRRRVLYELLVDVPSVVDLACRVEPPNAPPRSGDALASVGLTIADITSDDHRACQRIGGAVAWLGRGGILVPSARSSGENLVILMGPGGDSEIQRVGQTILFEAP